MTVGKDLQQMRSSWWETKRISTNRNLRMNTHLFLKYWAVRELIACVGRHELYHIFNLMFTLSLERVGKLLSRISGRQRCLIAINKYFFHIVLIGYYLSFFIG